MRFRGVGRGGKRFWTAVAERSATPLWGFLGWEGVALLGRFLLPPERPAWLYSIGFSAWSLRVRIEIWPLFSSMAQWTSSTLEQPAARNEELSSWCVRRSLFRTSS